MVFPQPSFLVILLLSSVGYGDLSLINLAGFSGHGLVDEPDIITVIENISTILTTELPHLKGPGSR